MKSRTKLLISVICVATLLTCAVVGTFAWLVAKTDPVKNTFTFGNVDITLTETEGTVPDPENAANVHEFKILPGKTVAKNPTVTVKAGSEKCYLFVEVTKENDFDTYITYAIADGWAELDGEDGVYYRTVDMSNTDSAFPILAGNTVTVKDSVTKEQIDAAVLAGTLPSMSFVAYAVQFEGVADAATAWGIAKA